MNKVKREVGKDRDIIEIWEILSRVSRNSRRKITGELYSLEIKPVEYKVLYVLSRDGTKSLVSLASCSEVSGPWITGVVDELVRKGLVKKIRSNTDRRVIHVTITEKGKEVTSKGTLAYKRLIEMAMRDLTTDEISEFLSVLKKIDRTIKE
ncbi:MAG: MarR family winged helix-turn-helix transcriptional regulator [Thermoplasmata archaeon]